MVKAFEILKHCRAMVRTARGGIQSIASSAAGGNRPEAVITWHPSSEPIIPLETRGRHLNITFWPHYLSNPYQELLNGRNGTNYTFEPGDLDKALARQANSSSEELSVFHLHWLNAIIRPTDPPIVAAANAKGFLEKLDTFLRHDGLFVWTVHNVVSHDTPHYQLEADFSRALAKRVSILHVHGNAAVTEAQDVFPIDPTKVVIAEHGSYIGVYPDSISRTEARRKFDLGRNSVAFMLFGQIRPYKGAERLISELSNLGKVGDQVPVSIIAGSPTGIDAANLSHKAGGRVRTILHLRRIVDSDVQIFMRASDFLVLPFQRILTSGSAILGLSFGLPVIAPQAGLLPSLITDGQEGFLYDPLDPNGLSNCLRTALSLPPSKREEMGAAAKMRALSLDWRQSRSALLSAIVRNASDG